MKLDDRIPPNLAEWINWLRRQIPTNVAEIGVEGVFEANSKVVLLRLPVAIWDMLPDHDAYGFVGYVRSSNLVVKELETALSAVPPSLRMEFRDRKRNEIPSGSSEWP